MSTSSKIAKGAGYLTMNSFFMQFFGFLSLLILSNYWQKEAYGTYRFIFSFYMIGIGLSNFGIDTTISAEILLLKQAKEFGRIKRLLKEHLRLKLIVGLGSILLLVGISSFFTGHVEHAMTIFFIAGVYILFHGLKSMYECVYYVAKDFRMIMVLNFLESAFRISAIVSILVISGKNISTNMQILFVISSFPLALAVVQLLLLPSLFLRLNYLSQVKAAQEGQLRKIIFRNGKYAVFNHYTKSFYEQIPIWIITATIGKETLAVFDIAKRGYMMLLSFFAAIERSLFPTTIEKIENHWDTVRQFLQRGIKYSFFMAVVLIAIFYLLAPTFFTLIWGDKYAGSIILFRIFILMLLVKAFELVQAPVLMGLRQQRYIFLASIFGMILLSLTVYTAILSLGLVGVPLSLITVNASYVMLQHYFIRKCKPDFSFRLRDLIFFDNHDRRFFTRAIAFVKNRFFYHYSNLTIRPRNND